MREAGAAGVVAVGEDGDLTSFSTSFSTDRWVAASIWCSVKAIHVSVAVLKKGDIRFSRV